MVHHTFESLNKLAREKVKNLFGNKILRVLLDLACGTGKTLIGHDVIVDLNLPVAVVMVPSLNLAAQLSNKYREQNSKLNFLFTCSDKSVAGGHEDLVTLDTKDLHAAILRAVESGEQLVIFSTYQSSDIFVNLYREYPDAPAVNLCVYDEAHYVSQPEGGLFNCTLNDRAVKFERRLFMTATPKEAMRKPEFAALALSVSTAKAIEWGLVKDYYMAIATVTNADVAALINTDKVVGTDEFSVSAHYAAIACAIAKSVQECDVHNLVSFHSTVDGAKELARAWNLIASEFGLQMIEADWVDGTMSAAQIREKIARLGEGNYLLTSCQCLGCGVDVPTLSALVFSDPKEAEISIEQAVGRGTRPGFIGDREPVPVILPTVLEDGAVTSRFRNLIRFLARLRIDDDIYVAGNARKVSVSPILSMAPGAISLVGFDAKFDQNFIDAIELEINGSTSRFDVLAFEQRCQEYEDFIDANWNYPKSTPGRPGAEITLGLWATTQRVAREAGALSDEKFEIISRVIPDFVWNLSCQGKNSSAFEKRYNLLTRYLRVYGEYPPKSHPISQWFKASTSPGAAMYKATVSDEQIARLKENHAEYYKTLRDLSNGLTDDGKDKFLLKMKMLRDYVGEHGCFPNASGNGTLHIYRHRLDKDLQTGKFPERKAWLTKNWPGYFSTPSYAAKVLGRGPGSKTKFEQQVEECMHLQEMPAGGAEGYAFCKMTRTRVRNCRVSVAEKDLLEKYMPWLLEEKK